METEYKKIIDLLRADIDQIDLAIADGDYSLDNIDIMSNRLHVLRAMLSYYNYKLTK